MVFTNNVVDAAAEINKGSTTKWGLIDREILLTPHEVKKRSETEKPSQVPARHYNIDSWTRVRGMGN